MPDANIDRQLEVLRLYGRLVGEREEWGGGLVLACGEGSAESGIAAAVSIAGGAALVVDADAAAVKLAMRRSELDFVVNTLDEALRTLKNQIRQHRPLAVGLIAEVGAALAEMVERGVLPDVLLVGPRQGARAWDRGDVRALGALGMPLRLTGVPDPNRPQQPMILDRGRYHECEVQPLAGATLRDVDSLLLDILPKEAQVRRRWVQRVGQYVRRERTGGRWMWLSDAEREALAQSVLICRLAAERV